MIAEPDDEQPAAVSGLASVLWVRCAAAAAR